MLVYLPRTLISSNGINPNKSRSQYAPATIMLNNESLHIIEIILFNLSSHIFIIG